MLPAMFAARTGGYAFGAGVQNRPSVNTSLWLVQNTACVVKAQGAYSLQVEASGLDLADLVPSMRL
jgi:hypothetical protein